MVLMCYMDLDDKNADGYPLKDSKVIISNISDNSLTRGLKSSPVTVVDL